MSKITMNNPLGNTGRKLGNLTQKGAKNGAFGAVGASPKIQQAAAKVLNKTADGGGFGGIGKLMAEG